ncbi:transposase [Paraburkholderia caffeinilytica]|uniref:transposase n=1 Tax=Paraburkholderia caffeinilytica TaxID=1761016 RepID=UPI003DA0C6FA
MDYLELCDDEWALIAPLVDCFERHANRRGRPNADVRRIVNALVWIFTTGEPWSDLPLRYPSVPTVRRQYGKWRKDGVLEKVFHRLEKNGRTLGEGYAERIRFCHDTATNPPSTSSPENGQRVGDHNRPGNAESAKRGNEEPGVAAWGVPALNNSRVYRPYGLKSSPPGIEINYQARYVIRIVVEPVGNAMYRASAEVRYDGNRIARSGLIGPRCLAEAEAKTIAMNWALDQVAAHRSREAGGRAQSGRRDVHIT